MSQILTLELPDDLYTPTERRQLGRHQMAERRASQHYPTVVQQP